MMPEMDGFELVTALQGKAAWREIPIVVVTALDVTTEDRRRRGGRLNQILSKQAFPLAEVMAHVCALLEEGVQDVVTAPPQQRCMQYQRIRLEKDTTSGRHLA